MRPLLVLLCLCALLPLAAPAAAPSADPVDRRLARLEAYLDNAPPPAPSAVAGPGHNAFMMVSAALVLFMTLPGLFLFYGGLVRARNVLSVAAQCLGVAALVALLWWAFGYSLVFGRNLDGTFLGRFYGGTEFLFLQGVTSAPNPDYAPWVSQNVFAVFQLAFAIITPALIFGATAERMRFSAVLAFTALWLLLVYIPVTHLAWGANGAMNGLANPAAEVRAVDFAGGTVVEMACGWSSLVLCLLVGRRAGFGRLPMPPHSMVLCMAGTGMLWVGWYGFNAGSALAADGVAAQAFATTTFAGAAATATWGLLERLGRGRASVLGMCSGAVAGLVAITPAAGFVSIGGAVLVGAVGSAAAYGAVMRLKGWLRYDDALDTFGVHGVAGTVGLVLTGLLATSAANPALGNHLSDLLDGGLVLEQLKAVGVTLTLCLAGTLVAGFAVDRLVGLRPSEEDEARGLDIADHGEEGYALKG